jgi:hypothetical protein
MFARSMTFAVVDCARAVQMDATAHEEQTATKSSNRIVLSGEIVESWAICLREESLAESSNAAY